MWYSMGNAVMYIVLMLVIGLIGHVIAKYILSVNVLEDFKLDDSDEID